MFFSFIRSFIYLLYHFSFCSCRMNVKFCNNWFFYECENKKKTFSFTLSKWTWWFHLRNDFEQFRQLLMIHFHMSCSESEFTNSSTTKSFNEKETNHICNAIAHTYNVPEQWAHGIAIFRLRKAEANAIDEIARRVIVCCFAPELWPNPKCNWNCNNKPWLPDMNRWIAPHTLRRTGEFFMGQTTEITWHTMLAPYRILWWNKHNHFPRWLCVCVWIGL